MTNLIRFPSRYRRDEAELQPIEADRAAFILAVADAIRQHKPTAPEDLIFAVPGAPEQHPPRKADRFPKMSPAQRAREPDWDRLALWCGCAVVVMGLVGAWLRWMGWVL